MSNPLSQSQPILDLLRRTEEDRSTRDSIDNFESQHSTRRWDASLYKPVVDEVLIARFPAWRDGISWPDGKRFAACLTHDMDSVQLNSRFELLRTIRQHIGHSQRLSKKLGHVLSLSALRRSPREIDIFNPWLAAEERFGFRSTFFVFPTRVRNRHVRDNVYRWGDRTTYRDESCSVRNIVKDLHRRGWDIGMHGSYLSAKSYDMVAEQKEDVEEALGETVVASRQHNLHFDTRVTPQILEKAGLKVDSTLGFNRDIGFRAGISYPFRMWNLDNEQWLSITEIPLVLHDGALLRRDNLDLDPESALALCKRLIDRVIDTKGVITLLWHPESIARPGWFDVYEKLLAHIHEQNGWGASARQIYEWWTSQGLDNKLQNMLDTLSVDHTVSRRTDMEARTSPRS